MNSPVVEREVSRASLDRLLLITPERSLRETADALRAALAAGARLIQLRVKSGSDSERLIALRELVALCREYGATVIVNDRADLAAAVDADGVHLGLEDLPVGSARDLLGARALIGATCRNVDQARQAEGAGADYIGLGPVFSTTTKSGLPPVVGPDVVAEVAAAVGIPVFAIGGISGATQARDLIAAGAFGVAVVSAVFGQPDPAAVVARLILETGGAR